MNYISKIIQAIKFIPMLGAMGSCEKYSRVPSTMLSLSSSYKRMPMQ
jgi:hypothetical protein